MKYLSKMALGIIFATIPVFAMADIVTAAIPTPINISPADNVALKSVNFTNVDWSDVIVSTTTGTTTSTTTAKYNYEASFVPTVNADGSFLTPITASTLLASSSMQVAGVAAGTYYWHVRAVDISGATSTWSTSTKVLVDNMAPTAPGTTTLTSSIQPSTSTVNGLQMWSFIPSTDNFSGVARYEYNINSSSTWLSNLLNTSFATTLGIGTHTLAIRAVDRADNISSRSMTTFTVSSSSTSATSTATTTPKNKDDCKRGDWKSFLMFYFKNQGRCVSFVEKNDRDEKKEEKKRNEDHKKHEKEARKEVSKREKEIKNMMKKFEKSESKQGRN